MFALTNTQLSKLKSVAKNNTRTTLRFTIKKISRRWIVSWIISKNKTKKCNISTDLKLSKAELSKIIQPD